MGVRSQTSASHLRDTGVPPPPTNPPPPISSNDGHNPKLFMRLCSRCVVPKEKEKKRKKGIRPVGGVTGQTSTEKRKKAVAYNNKIELMLKGTEGEGRVRIVSPHR